MTELTHRTAAETLRAAAALLRERAAQATPGPWDYDQFEEDGPWMVVRDDPFLELVETRAGEGQANAKWVATVHPGLAEPLAVLLEHQADACAFPWPFGTEISMETANALAVACMILGETSEGAS